MLVSGKTIMVWDGWSNVPPFISKRVAERKDGDWIVYVPKVVRSTGKMAPNKNSSVPKWVLALEQKTPGAPIRFLEYEHGFVFIGEDIAPVLQEERKESNNEKGSLSE